MKQISKFENKTIKVPEQNTGKYVYKIRMRKGNKP